MAVSTSTEHGLPFFLGFGKMTLGWAWVGMGRAEEGVAEILAGMEVYKETGSELGNSLWLGCLAEGYLACGRREEARAAWAQAVAFMNRTGEGVYRRGLQRIETQLGR
jgi:adenylate cyclase